MRAPNWKRDQASSAVSSSETTWKRRLRAMSHGRSPGKCYAHLRRRGDRRDSPRVVNMMRAKSKGNSDQRHLS